MLELVALQDIGDAVATIARGQTFTAREDVGRDMIAAGRAAPANGGSAWDGLQWPESEVVILASGPSLSVEHCERVRAWRGAGAGRRCIAVNTTFRRALWADVLYACDAPWWRAADKASGYRNNFEEARATFAGQLWTQDAEAQRQFGVNRIESRPLPGLSKRAGVIHQGGNGGYQAIGLAVQAGAKRVVLLGFDMSGTHWHGRYENGLANTGAHLFATWVQGFARLADDLRAAGVDVVNCTPTTALRCFPAADLDEVLA